MPKMNSIPVAALVDLSINFPGDAHELAIWLLKYHDAYDSKVGGRSRTTVHGLTTQIARLTHASVDQVRAQVEVFGLPANATIEWNSDVEHGC